MPTAAGRTLYDGVLRYASKMWAQTHVPIIPRRRRHPAA